MSYARFGWEGSDVYVYSDVRGYLLCCACIMADKPFDGYEAHRTAQMVEHLEEHRRRGHCVPQETIDDLLADAEDNDAYLAGLTTEYKGH